MIAAVKGTLEYRGDEWIVIQVGGAVSLRVFVPATTLEHLPPSGQQVHLYTHLHVREDELTLYGFATEEARRLFEMLLGVAGVGPKVALGVLSALNPEAVALAIASGDVDALSAAPGVGRKTAGRIILELRGKLEQEWGPIAVATASPGQSDVLRALLALGYTPGEARQALTGEDRADLPLEERVRRALQRMGSG